MRFTAEKPMIAPTKITTTRREHAERSTPGDAALEEDAALGSLALRRHGSLAPAIGAASAYGWGRACT